MFGGPRGATRRQRTGTGRQIRTGWQKQESQAGKGPWEDGRSRKHTQHCRSPTGGEEGEMGARICTDAAVPCGDGEHCRHPWTIPACPREDLAGGCWEELVLTPLPGVMSMKGGVMLGTIISPRLPNRVF